MASIPQPRQQSQLMGSTFGQLSLKVSHFGTRLKICGQLLYDWMLHNLFAQEAFLRELLLSTTLTSTTRVELFRFFSFFFLSNKNSSFYSRLNLKFLSCAILQEKLTSDHLLTSLLIWISNSGILPTNGGKSKLSEVSNNPQGKFFPPESNFFWRAIVFYNIAWLLWAANVVVLQKIFTIFNQGISQCFDNLSI